jgi:hypothetical protein
MTSSEKLEVIYSVLNYEQTPGAEGKDLESFKISERDWMIVYDLSVQLAPKAAV